MTINDICSKYVAWLRALYLIHQNHHWVSKGANFYGKHLLFERIYKVAQDSSDLAAEKIIGIFGEEAFQMEKQSKLISAVLDKFSSGKLILDSLEAEKEFIKVSQEFYEWLKSEDKMTLGLDDMIMSISSNHESNIYLLTRNSEEGTMDKLSALAQKFKTKLAQVANQSAPTLVDPNAGPKNGAEAQARLDNSELQEIGTAVRKDLSESLGMSAQMNNLRFTELRFVNDTVSGKKAISWKMVVAKDAVKQYQNGLNNLRKTTPSFSVGRYITQLFMQKLPGIEVMPAQPITIG